jgi:DNA-directed RNA polymerase subunit N (RpoN/RPB10)
MLPPKCFTCGRIFADIELEYEKKIQEIENNKKLSLEEMKELKRKLLDDLHVHRYCCRSRILTYVDLIQIII